MSSKGLIPSIFYSEIKIYRSVLNNPININWKIKEKYATDQILKWKNTSLSAQNR